MIVADPVELTTALTDLLMVAAGAFGMFRVATLELRTFKARLWFLMFLLFTCASLMGAVHHGVVLSTFAYDFSWSAVLFTLGILIALFVVAVVNDLAGATLARRLLPVMILIAVGFFVISVKTGEDFRLFLMFQAMALLLAMVGYGYLALKGRPGTLAITAGIAITVLASLVQATRAVTFVPDVPFDHNAVYHVIQTTSVILLALGARRSLV